MRPRVMLAARVQHIVEPDQSYFVWFQYLGRAENCAHAHGRLAAAVLLPVRGPFRCVDTVRVLPVRNTWLALHAAARADVVSLCPEVNGIGTRILEPYNAV